MGIKSQQKLLENQEQFCSELISDYLLIFLVFCTLLSFHLWSKNIQTAVSPNYF